MIDLARPVAVLVALLLLVAGACPPAAVATPQAEPGYFAADDRDADVAAFKLEKGAAPGCSWSPFFSLPCQPGRQGPACPALGRAPGATRDRSPPVH